MSAVYLPMSISKKTLLVPSPLTSAIHIFFKPCHSKFMIFCTKIDILEKYLYINHTLFILYLQGNHILFGENLYFIWKFSSGNTELSHDKFEQPRPLRPCYILPTRIQVPKFSKKAH